MIGATRTNTSNDIYIQALSEALGWSNLQKNMTLHLAEPKSQIIFFKCLCVIRVLNL